MLQIDTKKLIIAIANSMLGDVDLSKNANVSRNIISELKTGKKTTVRPQTLGKLARALGVRVEDLVEGTYKDQDDSLAEMRWRRFKPLKEDLTELENLIDKKGLTREDLKVILTSIELSEMGQDF